MIHVTDNVEIKDSGVEWIGKIPYHWTTRKIKATATISSGDYIDKDEYIPDGEIDIIGSNGAIGHTNKFNISTEDTLITTGRVGSIGTAHYIKGKAWVTDNVLILSPKNIETKYLGYLIPNLNFELITSGTAQPLITATKLKNQLIPYPPLCEQAAITHYLDAECAKVDSIINEVRDSIEDYKKWKISTVNDAITHGLNNTVESKKTDVHWIGNMPKHWQLKRLKYIFAIKKEIAGETGHTVLAITQQGIKPKNMSEKGQFALDYSKYQLVRVNDFAMNHMDLLTGWVDMSRYAGVTSPDYRVFSALDPDEIDAGYYKHLFQNCYRCRIFYGLGQGVSGFGRWRLPAEVFLNFVLPVPPLNEQKEIAAFLDIKCAQIDELITEKQALIADLEAYKKSLIYEVVTGKRKVV